MTLRGWAPFESACGKEGKPGFLALSSVFKTADTDALISALPRILPVLVKTRADGSQEIISR